MNNLFIAGEPRRCPATAACLAASTVLLLFTAFAAAQDCALRWDPAFANPGANSNVRSLRVYDDGHGPALYAAGAFTVMPGSVAANRIAKWDGSAWSPLASGISGIGTPEIFATAIFQGRLHVGGTFSIAGGSPAARIAAWDGMTWSSLGAGISSTVFSLAATDAAGLVGSSLYAGGSFDTAGGASVSGIARWDGVTWCGLGAGATAVNGSVGTVNALLIFNDALYAGGAFTAMDGATVNYVARWDGSDWGTLAGGMGGEAFPNVLALAAFRAELYAGGNFTTAGDASCSYVARWDGAAWQPLGLGTSGVANLRSVNVMTVYDDGTGVGEALYVGGQFITAGGLVVNNVARWDGASWSALRSVGGVGTNSSLQSLAGFDDGVRRALYAGGLFTTAAGRTSRRIARWWCIPLLPEGCCVSDGACHDLDYNQCSELGGQSYGFGTTCATIVCPAPPQACCLPDGGCRDLSPRDCMVAGGRARGLGTRCGGPYCIGACCLPDNHCSELLADQCAAAAGFYFGEGTQCTATTCPRACCMADGSCRDLLYTDCQALGGTLQGVGSNCAAATCPMMAACCLSPDECHDMFVTVCQMLGGASEAPGVLCHVTICHGDCALVRRGDFDGDALVTGADIAGFSSQFMIPDSPGTPSFCAANFISDGDPEKLDDADLMAFIECLLAGEDCHQ